jgi:carboxymethylenebutenolidase
MINDTRRLTKESGAMNSQWIDIKSPDGNYGAYLSLPPGGKGPGLVVFEEIFGVNRHIRAVADQYAMDGFVALAPDVFWRQGARLEFGYEGEERERAIANMKSMDPKQVAEDIKITAAALRARPEVGGAKVGAIGYCMGGRLAYIAAAIAGVDAAVSYYGGGIHDQLDRAASIKCPIQFHYGEKDQGIPMDAVEKVKAAFKGKSAQFHIYPAGHGFNCWDRSAYHAPSAALAHGRSVEFLAKSLF